MKLVIFSRYTPTQASTRVRFIQFIPALSAAGFQIDLQHILEDESVNSHSSLFKIISSRIFSLFRVMRQIKNIKQPALLHIHIELFPWIPYFIENSYMRLVGIKKYSIELDDAWFHRYEDHNSILARYLLGNKINKLMKNASVVIAGNQYIADRAIEVGSRIIEVIPTVVDTDKYLLNKNNSNTNIKFHSSTKPVIGWIGSPSTTKFLCAIKNVINHIHNNNIATFVAIGADANQLEDIAITAIPWSQSDELEKINAFDIGIMPLNDSLFERGKCGYKIIQYMACGLPVVASPVGVNSSIIIHGKSGFLATSEAEWIEYLSILCSDPDLRSRLGHIGLQRATDNYSLNAVAPKVVSIFKKISDLN